MPSRDILGARSLSRRQGDACRVCVTLCYLCHAQVTNSSRNAWHPMSRTRTSQCSHDKSWHLENKFLPRHDMARTTSPDPHRYASPRRLSRVLPSLARQITCHGVNPLLSQCDACEPHRRKYVRLELKRYVCMWRSGTLSSWMWPCNSTWLSCLATISNSRWPFSTRPGRTEQRGHWKHAVNWLVASDQYCTRTTWSM